MRTLGTKLFAGFAVVAAVVLIAWRSTRTKSVPVVFGVVDRGRVERTVANTRAGTVNACRRAKLAPPSGGQIVALPVREGDRVHAGDTLLELWSQSGVAEQKVAQEQARGELYTRRDECHFNADGHRVAAEVLTPAVKRLLR